MLFCNDMSQIFFAFAKWYSKENTGSEYTGTIFYINQKDKLELIKLLKCFQY